MNYVVTNFNIKRETLDEMYCANKLDGKIKVIIPNDLASKIEIYSMQFRVRGYLIGPARVKI